MRRFFTKLMNFFRRVGIINTALSCLVVLVIVISIIVSASYSSILYGFKINGYGDQDPPISEDSTRSVKELLNLAVVCKSMGDTAEAKRLVDLAFEKKDSDLIVKLYLQEMICVETLTSEGGELPPNVVKFVNFVDLISDHIPIGEIVSDFLPANLTQKYTNSFYYAYKSLIPKVTNNYIYTAIENSERKGLYRAYVLRSAIGDAASLKWLQEHRLLNTEIITDYVNGNSEQTLLHYDRNGVLTERADYYDTAVYVTMYEYNEDGSLKFEERLYAPYEASHEYVDRTVVYSYTVQGLLSQRITQEYNSNGEAFSQCVEKYGTDGRIISEAFSMDGLTTTTTYVHVYDDVGRLTEMRADVDGSITQWHKYSYNNEIHPFLPSDKFDAMINVLYSYTYDNSGKILRDSRWTSGRVDSETHYIYDALGNLRAVTENGNTLKTYNYSCLKIQ